MELMDSGIRVLHAEDDGNVRELLTSYVSISYPDIDVDTAANGREAFDMIDGETYDCIIADNHMPKLSGVDLIKKVRDESIRVPVVFYTGDKDPKVVAEIENAGAEEIYIKGETDCKKLLSDVTKISNEGNSETSNHTSSTSKSFSR
ncbi:MAG: response regulator [Haloarcula sp.]